jgi:tripartite-type tricarboxylate transporter receptor subunit TctC
MRGGADCARWLTGEQRAPALPDVQEKFASLGLFPLHSPPERVMELVKTGSERMGKVVKAAGIQPE